MGCYKDDGSHGSFALSAVRLSELSNATKWTPELCRQACLREGKVFMQLQIDGAVCFCSNGSFGTRAELGQVPDTKCGVQCGAESFHRCGDIGTGATYRIQDGGERPEFLPCPRSCKSPHCQSGEPANGGQPVTGAGGCSRFCSRPFDGVRYCGAGEAYEDGDYIDCSACAAEKRSNWLSCLGDCGGKNLFEPVLCPKAAYLVKLHITRARSRGGLQVVGAACSDGSVLQPGGSYSEKAESGEEVLVQQFGSRGVAVNSDLENGLSYLRFGDNETQQALTGTSTTSMTCPWPRQRLAGYRLSGRAAVSGVEFYCAELQQKASWTPCHGSCQQTQISVAVQCPEGAFITRLDFQTSQGGRLDFLTGGVCNDGTVLPTGAEYACEPKNTNNVTMLAPDGSSSWEMSTLMPMAFFRLHGCDGNTTAGNSSCEVGLTQAADSSPATIAIDRFSCPEHGQLMAGWELTTSCTIDGVKFKCAEPAPEEPGWSQCHGDCKKSSEDAETKKEKCPDGSYLTSLTFAEHGFATTTILGGYCSDGSFLAAGNSSGHCNTPISSRARLSSLRGARSWRLAGNPSSKLAYFMFGSCADGSCEHGWRREGDDDAAAFDFQCPLPAQRLAGWHVFVSRDGCSVNGMRFYCVDEIESSVVKDVTYCQPGSFMAPADAEEPVRSVARVHSKCGGYCNVLDVSGAGDAHLDGRYQLDTSQLSDSKPIWRQMVSKNYTTGPGHVLLRHAGEWRIDDESSTAVYVADGKDQSLPPSGRWQSLDSSRGVAPLVYCDSSSGRSNEDPCWKPHPDCKSDFVYKGVTYTGCTTVDSNQHWCGTSNTTLWGADWALCAEDLVCRRKQKSGGVSDGPAKLRASGHLCWLPAPSCVSHFYYKGKSYHECARDATTGQHWCSEVEHFEDAVGGWKLCTEVLCKRGGQVQLGTLGNVTVSGNIGGSLNTRGEPCLQTADGDSLTHSWLKIDLGGKFKVSKLVTVGKVDTDSFSVQHWKVRVGDTASPADDSCTDSVNASGLGIRVQNEMRCAQGALSAVGRYVTVWSPRAIDVCDIQVYANVCWRPHSDCVKSFWAGKVTDGCVVTNGHAWCSLDAVFKGRRKDCEPVLCGSDTVSATEEASCYRPDPACSPVFEYEGTKHEQCTTAGAAEIGYRREQHWCSIDRVFNDDHAKCQEVSCEGCYVRDADCLSSFTYKGVAYEGCTSVDSFEYWCSLDAVVPEGKDRRTKPCRPCKKVDPEHALDALEAWPSDQACWTPAKTCVKEFMLEEGPVRGCTKLKSKTPWCSRQHEFRGDYDTCTPCPNCWQPNPECVPEFNYEGELVTGCYQKGGSHKPWCSLHRDFRGAWMECKLCSQQNVSWPTVRLRGYSRKASKPVAADEVALQVNFTVAHLEAQKLSPEQQEVLKASIAEELAAAAGVASDAVVVNISSSSASMESSLAQDLGSLQLAPSRRHQHRGDDDVVARITAEIIVRQQNSSGSKAAVADGRIASRLIAAVKAVPEISSATSGQPLEVSQPMVSLSNATKLCFRLNPKCAASFEYKNQDGSHYIEGCTLLDYHEHWCSPTRHFGGRFLPCQAVACDDCWQPASDCVSEFTYDGKTFAGCTNLHSSQYWCSLSKEFNMKTGKWALCRPCGQTGGSRAAKETAVVEDNSCYQPAESCVMQFEYGSKRFVGCTDKNSDRYWCSRDSVFTDAVGRWEYCLPTPCDACWLPDTSCARAFRSNGTIVKGCAPSPNPKKPHWCSVDEIYSEAYTITKDCQRCEEFTGKKKVKEETCHQPLASCQPEFLYKGKMFVGCTNTDSSFHWCATSREFQENSVDFNMCEEVKCNECWLRDPECADAWWHDGRRIEGCLVEGTDRPWCSKAVSYNSTAEWAFCTPCPRTDQKELSAAPADLNTCYKPANDCVSEFSYKGRLFSGCTSADSTIHWCSKDRNYDRHGRHALCHRVECDSCFLRDDACEAEFIYRGQRIEGCTRLNSDTSWCSLDKIYAQTSGRSLDCSSCTPVGLQSQNGQLAKCARMATDCVPQFEFKGKTYHGCIRDGASSHFWCSKTRINIGLQTERVSCAMTTCEECFIPAPSCKPTFEYLGTTYQGCSRRNSDSFWCSKDDVYHDGIADENENASRRSPCMACDPIGKLDEALATCWAPAPECVDAFTYKGITYTGCTDMDSDVHWCSQDVNMDLKKRWKPCARAVCTEEEETTTEKVCYQPDPRCAPAWRYQGETITGCTHHSSTRAWCSHDEMFTRSSKTSFCQEVSCDTCAIRAPTCLGSFEYKGRTIEGCTNDNKETYWCAKDAVIDDSKGSWTDCTPCREVVKNKTDICYQPVEECVPEMIFKSTRISGCAVDETGLHWCGHTRYVDDNRRVYSECRRVHCDDCWLRHPDCLSSWNYKGETVSGCSTTGRMGGKAWCSTIADMDDFSGAWRFCEPCRSRDVEPEASKETCWAPTAECVQPFWTDGQESTGCHLDAALGKAWCSKVKTSFGIEQQPDLRAWCNETPCDDVCWQPSEGCVSSFTTNGETITGCIETFGAKPWCSLVEDFDNNTEAWRPCKQVSCKSLCYKVAETCVLPFRYKGQVYNGCAPMEGSTKQWCSEIPELEDAGASWKYCEVDDCEKLCYMPRGECVQPFSYRNDVITGCIKEAEDEAPWCSHSRQLSPLTKQDKISSCPQVPCDEVCWQRSFSCLPNFVYKGKRYYGCVTDPAVLGEAGRPWCSTTQFYEDGSDEFSYCPQASCAEADCEGPQCDGYRIWFVNGRCLRPDLVAGANMSSKFGVALGDSCSFPDPDGLMMKEVPVGGSYVLLQHYSGRCLHPEAHRQSRGTRLVIDEPCESKDSMKFKKLITGSRGEFVLEHYSELCVTAAGAGDAVILVLGGSCPALNATVSTPAPLRPATAGDVLTMRPFPTSCEWDAWTRWSDCSVTCGSGLKFRKRTIKVHLEEGGEHCKGKKVEQIGCKIGCPVECELGDWDVWGPCSKTCGTGQRLRAKRILVFAANGAECHMPEEAQPCNEHACPSDCVRAEWSPWAGCSHTCGPGVRSRTRPVVAHPAHGGKPCGETPTMVQNCKQAECPQHCSFGQWGQWGTCDITCGDGWTHRSRLVAVEPKFGGKDCGPPPAEKKKCGLAECPVDCSYKTWGDWSTCTLSCGSGFRQRVRAEVPALFGGKPCFAGASQNELCNGQPCPIDCLWLEWSQWTSCSKSCEAGVSTRVRHYARAAEYGGKPCLGPGKESPVCNPQACPVDCVWEPWSLWRPCSATCGGGTRSRFRGQSASALHGGKNCIGSDKQEFKCAEKRCPIDCEWNAWSQFSVCSKSCDGGTRSRLRTRKQMPENGGLRCSGQPDETEYCNLKFPCPVDCEFRSWSSWSECTRSCGVGRRTRHRGIDIESKNGGKHCAGYLKDDAACNLRSCPIDCQWNPWTPWTECDKSCGMGSTARHRSRRFEQQNGGTSCLGDRSEIHVCNAQACPVDCMWLEWDNWRVCSQSCGGGHMRRIRNTKVAAANGGKPCVGEHKDVAECGQAPCPVDCKWAEWSPWGQCSKSCGGGHRSRTRAEIPGQAGGLPCRGASQSVQWCAVNHCPDSFNGGEEEEAARAASSSQLSSRRRPADGEGVTMLIMVAVGVIGLFAVGAFFSMGGNDDKRRDSRDSHGSRSGSYEGSGSGGDDDGSYEDGSDEYD
eukprot:TRINITY_DN8499_c0_g4_i1.p1 TRINITY_DN8499_c0_g4~~TRINITY_DN8499_c0_g4_i1.p1  ORF type:complete len:3773 (+),score=615.61 TRINITY_DN8499_c0_g4_i1:363-11321(+)